MVPGAVVGPGEGLVGRGGGRRRRRRSRWCFGSGGGGCGSGSGPVSVVVDAAVAVEERPPGDVVCVLDDCPDESRGPVPPAREQHVHAGPRKRVRGGGGLGRRAEAVREHVLKQRQRRRRRIRIRIASRLRALLAPRPEPEGYREGALLAVLDGMEQDEVLVVAVARDDGAEEVVGGPPAIF